MKTIILIILTNLLIICGAMAQGNYVPGRLIVSVKKELVHTAPKKDGKSMGNEAIDILNAQNGCKGIHTIMPAKAGYGGIYLLSFDETKDVVQLQRIYATTGLFRYAEPDYIGELMGNAPNDTAFHRQWSLSNDGSFDIGTVKAGADIDMLRAWNIEDGDTSVIVGIIDSGVKTDHPEFNGRIWINKHEIPNNDTDDDNNGYIDDINGWNMVTDTANVMDDNLHGTNVTGILAANANNTTGYAGVDHHCKLLVCKVADASGFITYSALMEGMAYAIDNGAKVLNISAGGGWPSAAFVDIDDYAYTHNVTMVAAMGNSHSSSVWYPAGCKHAIAVGATGPDDKATSFSNFGSHISVVAPGAYIYGLSNADDTEYGIFLSGTSQATPHVAGIAALLLAQNSSRTPAQIKYLIESNAEDMVGDTLDKQGWDKYYGHGRVNAYRTLVNEELAIKDKTASQPICSLYPNPTTGRVTVETISAGTLDIYTPTGQKVYNTTLKTGSRVIPLTGISTGVYFVTISSNGREQVTKLVIR